MKGLTQLITCVSFALFFVGNVNAQCGATAVDVLPDTVLVCEGDAGTTDFSASGTCTTGNWEFQVTQGATIVQAWSAATTFTASPTTTTIYTVFARCSACPTITAQSDFVF